MLKSGEKIIFLATRSFVSQPQLSEFVPKHAPVVTDDIKSLERFIDDHQKILILTGAGISTESGNIIGIFYSYLTLQMNL
jgi:hypothetical protein